MYDTVFLYDLLPIYWFMRRGWFFVLHVWSSISNFGTICKRVDYKLFTCKFWRKLGDFIISTLIWELNQANIFSCWKHIRRRRKYKTNAKFEVNLLFPSRQTDAHTQTYLKFPKKDMSQTYVGLRSLVRSVINVIAANNIYLLLWRECVNRTWYIPLFLTIIYCLWGVVLKYCHLMLLKFCTNSIYIRWLKICGYIYMYCSILAS